MDDLIAFLRARLDEREQRANSWPENVDYDENLWVLADVAAKRKIIDEHSPADVGYCPRCQWSAEERDDPAKGDGMKWILAPCPTLRLLVLPHADHPDYRAEWRP